VSQQANQLFAYTDQGGMGMKRRDLSEFSIFETSDPKSSELRRYK